MKFLKISLLVLSIALIFIETRLHLQWPVFVAAGLWVTVGIISFFEEKQKKAKAVFLVYDKPKTIFNYALWLGFLSVNYFFFSKRDSFADETSSFIGYLSLSAWLILSKTGDVYYLFDDTGIKTLRKNFDYEKLKGLRIDEKFLHFDSNETTNTLTIKKSLVNDEIINFLKDRISTRSSTPV